VNKKSPKKIARRSEELYERSVCEMVEPGHDGRFLALDVSSGDHEVADEALSATVRLRERKPDAVLYLMRVSRPVAFRMRGGSGGRRHEGETSPPSSWPWRLRCSAP
jgi:hypothetical protein